MKTRLTVLFLLTACSIIAQSPTIKGKVTISILKGTIDCDLVVTDYPMMKDYFIFLNKGLNIRYFRNMEDNNTYYYDYDFDGNNSGESMGYYFPAGRNKGKFLPKEGFRVSYTGGFPVYFDTLKTGATGDWKGNIAFNGKTLRASEQSAWYPVLYDISKDVKYPGVKYDIDLSCEDCETLYLNGSVPVSGRSANFKADKAFDLVLFAGNYKITNVDGTYFLNPDATDAQLKVFGQMTNAFKAFYEKKLGIPYGSKVTYIQTTPISRRNSWMFVSYPSIVNIGWGKYGLKQFVEEGNNSYTYIAHEIAHYYFGTYRTFNSELGDMISESFAEYLSIKASQSILGDSISRKLISKKINGLKSDTLNCFAKVKTEKDYRDRNLFVYEYAPLIYCAMEKDLGEEKMYAWIKSILTTKADFTNYEFLKQTLEAAVTDKAKLKLVLDNYFTADNSLQNAIKRIEQKK